MKRISVTVLLLMIFVLCSCNFSKEEQFNNDTEISFAKKERIKRKKSVKISKYINDEKEKNEEFVESLESLVDESVDKQIENFADEELGFFSNYGYMFKRIFWSKDRWNDELSMKSNHYFSSLNIEQQAGDLYISYKTDIENLRKQFVINGKNTAPVYFEFNLPTTDVSLEKLSHHTINNIFIEFVPDILGWLLALLIVFIISIFFTIQFSPSAIAAIVSLVLSIILTNVNDNKIKKSIKEQFKSEYSIDYGKILNELNENTTCYYEKYR